ncbi:MAG: DUF2007 domain-containing protein [Bdellovibrionaceae bacterium]|nr:DUF2007 domain-containing protein [Bdellovibrionales bacterium]MCB9083436.1 DUF2007 domain-containing protein [Pseudobdellovibrionaceae bacterium]
MKEKFEVIARFTDEPEAQLAKSFLESQGLTCHLRDRFTIGVNPFYSNALGGLRLTVLKEDAPRARQLLLQATNRQFELSEDQDPPPGLACPNCGSEETEYSPDHRKGWAIVILWLISIPLPFLARDRWLCRKCQNEWHVSHSQHPLNYIIPILLMTGLILFFHRYLSGD